MESALLTTSQRHSASGACRDSQLSNRYLHSTLLRTVASPPLQDTLVVSVMPMFKRLTYTALMRFGPLQDTLVVSVMEPAMTLEDELGRFSIAVRDIIQNVQVSRWTKEEDAGYIYDDFPIGGKTGKARIELELEFLPYW
jgi:hypothetical protein